MVPGKYARQKHSINKLIDKINDENISVKIWFKMGKQLMNKKGSSNVLTLVEDSTEGQNKPT